MKNLKKNLAVFAVIAMSVFCGNNASAVIACPDPVVVTQPDGQKVTLRLYGDEFYNYTLTEEGYNVVFNNKTRNWEFAARNADGTLASIGMTAADGIHPVAASRWERPAMTDTQRRKINAARNPLKLHGAGKFDYTKFRGLVILVEFNDAPFSRSDISEVMTDMVSKRGYDGYMTTDLLPSKVEYTGSVCDFYRENSGGRFDPVFDVVGPVKIDISQHYARQTSGAQRIVQESLIAADSLVDYSMYDTDGNRTVDMVYFIFSGAGSNYSGNDETLIWPHTSSVMGMSLDGVSFGRYACSTELYGNPANRLLDGIGTICHEFSHVLGLPDFYDVDYATNGQSVHPAKWSVMASGSYLNKSRTPCGYSLFERYALGFAQPETITEPGDYTLQPLNEGDESEGFRINSGVENEFFMLENRRKTGWDAYLPGEGLLIHRVDSTNMDIWENNNININPSHNYYTLIRATPKMSGSTVTDSDGDPFPGSGNVTAIDNTTDPSLRSWTQISTPLVLADIADNDNGTISFSVKSDAAPSLSEDFSEMPATTGDSEGLEGRFASWKLSKGALIETDSETGINHLIMKKGAEAESSVIDYMVENASVSITNPSSTSAVFRFYSSVDDGKTWVPVKTVEGTAVPSVKSGTTTIHYSTGTLEKPMFRLVQYTGSSSQKCMVNRITLGVEGKQVPTSIGTLEADGADTLPEAWYDLHGRRISHPTQPGIYVKTAGGKSKKIIVR